MPDETTIKKEIQNTIQQFFHAMDTQDLKLMEMVMAHDTNMIHIGTDRGEIWKGWEVMQNATEEQFKALESYKADISDLQINLSHDKNIAWYFHKLGANIKSNSEIKLSGGRFTGVLERRNGQWKIVQTHLSLSADS